MYEKNGIEFSNRTECIDWRYSAAILGLIKFFKFSDNMGYGLKYDCDDDYIYYNMEDITEERFLRFAENYFRENMYHIFVENELKLKDEFTEDEVKTINESLLGNTILKKYFSKNKFNGNNKEEILGLIKQNKDEITKKIFKPIYKRFNNCGVNLCPLTYKKRKKAANPCRVLGYYEDIQRKLNSLSYNYNKDNLSSDDNVLFDFIPFGFVIGSDAIFINNNVSISHIEETNATLYLKLNAEEQDKGRKLSAKDILFNMLIDSSDYIDYDVEVILKKLVKSINTLKPYT